MVGCWGEVEEAELEGVVWAVEGGAAFEDGHSGMGGGGGGEG